MSPPRFFDSECEGDTLIIVLLGDVSTLVPEQAKVELHLALEKLRPPDICNVVVDFEQIAYFGSLMLGSLQFIWERTKKSKGKMALCNLSPNGREVLKVVQFHKLWPICLDREEAIAAVQGDEK
jgi:anti-anti-sigma factor